MKQIEKKKQYKKNIEFILSKADSTDFAEGKKWYRDARLFCYQVSRTYGVSFRKVCAILAALSPRNRWRRNKDDCLNLVVYLSGASNTMPQCATYGAMVDKAIKLFNAKTDSIESMLKILNGQKIKAFFLNVYDFNSECVTVDSWIQLISLGKYLAVNERPSLLKTDYKLIEETIKEIAALNNVKPPVMQAVLWVSFKRLTESKDYN